LLTGKNFLNHAKKGTFDNSFFYRDLRTENQPQNDIKIEGIQDGLYADDEIEKHLPIRYEIPE